MRVVNDVASCGDRAGVRTGLGRVGVKVCGVVKVKIMVRVWVRTTVGDKCEI